MTELELRKLHLRNAANLMRDAIEDAKYEKAAEYVKTIQILIEAVRREVARWKS